MVDGIQKAIFKPHPQIKADSQRFFRKRGMSLTHRLNVFQLKFQVEGIHLAKIS